jgi:hypothetical protein
MARSRRRRRKWRRRLLLGGVAVVIVLALLSGTARYFALQLKPTLHEKTLNYLRSLFDGNIEIDSFDVSMPIGDPVRLLLEKGKGARIRVRINGIKVNHMSQQDLSPLILMNRLEFQLDLSTLWERPIRVDYVRLAEFELTIPPKGERRKLAVLSNSVAADLAEGKDKSTGEAKRSDQQNSAKPIVLIDHIDMDGMKLTVLPRNPDKEPLKFEMKTLRLESAGIGVPMRYRTTMTNAKPPGLIQCAGTFGPFVTSEPGESPLSGDYSFKDANLGVFEAIDGKLVSSGHFEGKLNNIVVDGQADVPDFRLKSAGNAVPLKTRFHAIVDGTDGDTLLQPVMATLGRSNVECRGGIARNKDDSKKTVNLNVMVSSGRIEDFVRLAVKGTKSPLLGNAQMKFQMRVPPGAGSVLSRLILDGTFSLEDAGFTSPTVQEKIDDISRRTQGKPSAVDIQGVNSDFEGSFLLGKGLLKFPKLLFAVPGAEVSLDGWYDINSENMDLRGVVRTKAKVSQMVKAPWKRVILKPVDPFFAKDGSGAVIRIAITGNRSNPQFARDKQSKTDRLRRAARIPAQKTTK